MEWSELIELLEKAVGPDQKLDELIERRLHKISTYIPLEQVA
jgi:hypothetical protein